VKISKSKINGKEYYYYSDTLYINRKVSQQVSRSLGSIESTSKEKLERRKLDVKGEIALLEAKARVEYWQKRTKNSHFSTQEIERLEKARVDLYRAKNDLGDSANSALETAFMVDFIYNSNRIEGSKVPRREVQEILVSSKEKNNEVINTAKAMSFVSDSFKFSLPSVVKLQKILVAHEPSNLGLRTFDNILVGNEEIHCKAKQIKSELRKLFVWYENNKYMWYPLELAFEFYRRFELIHPFPDGNGRTGRLIMNKILKDARYHPIIIWSKHDLAHKNAFKNCSEHPSKFMRFMSLQYKETYAIYGDKINPAMEYEQYVDFFLSPSQ